MSGTSQALYEHMKMRVMARLAAADPTIVDIEMRAAIQAVLQDTRVWERKLRVPMVPGQTLYELDAFNVSPAPIAVYESVAGMKVARYDGGLPIQLSLPLEDTSTGSPSAAGLESDRLLRVYPIPGDGVDKYLDFTVWMVPLQIQEPFVPDVLRPFETVLMNEALGLLFAIPDKPWTNLTLATFHSKRASHQKSRIRWAVTTGRTAATYVVPIPPFA